MAFNDLDFGIYGKGFEGYVHYMTATEISASTTGDIAEDVEHGFNGYEDYSDRIEELQGYIDELELDIEELRENSYDSESFEEEERIEALEGYLHNMEDRLESFRERSTLPETHGIGIPITITVTTSVGEESHEEKEKRILGTVPNPLPPNYDLTYHYVDGELDYRFGDALQKAMSDYFLDYSESYAESKKGNRDILDEIFGLEKELALEMWKWQLEHFGAAIGDANTGWEITSMGGLDSEVFEWIYKTEKDNNWFWEKILGVATSFYDCQVEFLRLALENNDVDKFHEFMGLYFSGISHRTDESYKLDEMLEALMDSYWEEPASDDVVSAITKYISMVKGRLRRAALEKRCGENVSHSFE